MRGDVKKLPAQQTFTRENIMAKYDQNGVRHDGWASVGEANRTRTGRSGTSDRDYETTARSQGVDLSNTGYRKTSGYRYKNL